MYATGGTLGIVMAYITVDFSTLADFFISPRAWQFFLYHAMTVTLGLYAGLGPESSLSLPDPTRFRVPESLEMTGFPGFFFFCSFPDGFHGFSQSEPSTICGIKFSKQAPHYDKQ